MKKFIGVDLAKEGSEVTALHARQTGKSLIVQKCIDAYIKAHPNVTIIYSDGRIERPVKGRHK